MLLSGLAKAEEESSQPVEIANHGLDLNYMAGEAGAAWIIQGVEIDGMGLAGLNVAQVEVFAPDASIIIDDGLPTYSVQDPPTTRFLRGKIVGIPGSLVALMQTDEGMISGLMTDGDITWRVYRSSLEAPLETARIDSDAATMKKPFACGNEQLPDLPHFKTVPADAKDPPPSAELPVGQLYQATIAIETDYEFFALFGNNSAALNYIGNLYNYISGIYETEIQTRFLVGNVYLWTTTADPWVETSSTSCRLYEFGRYWRNNRAAIPRTLAHFLSGASLGGGVAWLDQLCVPATNYTQATGCATIGSDLVYGGFGVSADLEGSISTAVGPAWDAVVVAHEMGHNFSSPHTHCYNNIGGSASPVDACWNTESGCWSGATSLPGVASLTGGTASSRNGTLMSYCHQLTGGIANIAGSFGLGHPYGIVAQRVPDRMLNRIAAVAASNPSCIPVISEGVYTVTATAGANGTISPASQTVAHGATTTFTVTPNAGYSASASGCGGSLSGTTYTTGAITAACTVSATFSLIPTLGVALDNTSLTWTTGGNANWYGQTAISHDGVDAAQSGDIADSQNSWMQTALTGPGTLSFYWRVSSEPDYDYLRFYIDDVEQSGSISGAVDWQQQSRAIPSGTHTVKWAYTKDGIVSTSSDAAWVDQVAYAPTTSYTVTATAGPNGSISPTTVQVAHGGTTSFTITPDPGYYRSSFATNCSGSLSGDTFTTGAITAPCSVTVGFAQASYTVSVSVTASDPSATEAGLTTGTFTFSRTGDTAPALTVNYTVEGTATAGSDYLALGTSVSFAAGATTATKTVTPVQDSLIEANETILLTLAPGTGYTVGTPASATVTLTSDDLATTVSVSASDASATEAGLTTGRYTFTRAGGTTTALTVNYTVEGTATAGSDYLALGTSVSFAAGATTATKTVTPVQ
ncbi:MAG: hypothetical protein KA125_06610, partial [Chromatiaceae bacterium]|nr:hypothetical protein [Chromatiaceae bacterium]